MNPYINNLLSSEKNNNIDNLYDDDDYEDDFWQSDDFEIGNCLGNGKFGYVYRAKEKKNNKELALKVICKTIVTQFNFYEQLKNEIEIHTRLIHKNIVRMYGYFYDNSYVYLVYECLNKGSLFQYIKNVNKLDEKKAAKFTYQLALGLEYLKKRNIIHRDLKLENIMLEDDEINNSINLKLADFGWAAQHFSENHLAPEMVNNQPYDFGIDIWALGIITYEMVTGYSPFSGNETDILNQIKIFEGINSIQSYLEEIDASDDLFNFFENILHPDNNKRIKIEEILNHPWIVKNNTKN